MMDIGINGKNTQVYGQYWYIGDTIHIKARKSVKGAGNLINLRDIYFGCSDADTEAERKPEIFKKVFFDPHNYLEDLLRGNRFMLRGRKGDGKTAFSAQMQLIADSLNIYACKKSLNNFNNVTFSEIKSYDALGGNPYISFWKCIILIEYVGMIVKFEPNVQTPDFVSIVSSLNEKGFISVDNDIALTIKKLVETDSTLNIKNAFQHQRKYGIETHLCGAEEIYRAVRDSIKNIYLAKSFALLIDGLDDILINSEFKPEIITGLIRAINEINSVFNHTTLRIKTIIFIRDDILALCRDPNLSKITRDSSIHLSWTIDGDPFDSDLLQLVEKRVVEATGGCNSLENVWSEIFPPYIGSKPSVEYVLDNIIYRPRDILQFFIEVQKEFQPGQKITIDKLQTVLEKYSDEYFVDAMEDELTGFFPNEVVTHLPDVLMQMGSQYFYQDQFQKECSNYTAFTGVSTTSILERLFNAGYIGQHRPKTKNDDYTVFSYRNPREKFVPEHECIVHRGLRRALTIP